MALSSSARPCLQGASRGRWDVKAYRQVEHDVAILTRERNFYPDLEQKGWFVRSKMLCFLKTVKSEIKKSRAALSSSDPRRDTSMCPKGAYQDTHPQLALGLQAVRDPVDMGLQTLTPMGSKSVVERKLG